MFALLPSSLNLLSVGADAAAARGVDVGRDAAAGVLQRLAGHGAAVSLAGPIGFIGIVVPHLVRLMVGVDHRIVLPASALFGAAFLVVCDLVARTLLAPVEIPVGVDHGNAWRAVLLMAAGTKRLIVRLVAAPVGAVVASAAVGSRSHDAQPRPARSSRSASSRWCRR